MDIHNIVLLGEAGSGKTEIAANIALLLLSECPIITYLTPASVSIFGAISPV